MSSFGAATDQIGHRTYGKIQGDRNSIAVIVQIGDPSGLIELGSGPVQGSFGSVQGYIF